MYLYARPRPEPAAERPELVFGPLGRLGFTLAGAAMGGLIGFVAGAVVVAWAVHTNGRKPDDVTTDTYLFWGTLLVGSLCAGLGGRCGLYFAELPRERLHPSTPLPPPLTLRHTEPVSVHAGGDPMSATVTPPPKAATPVHYPDDDGLPMSDNTQQMKWIFRLYGNLTLLYRARDDVFVAANHLIYPVEGDNKKRQAPDVFVAFGRSKVDRGSYRVWEEDGIFPQVVFEIWSPGNRYAAMRDKFAFYEKHGAEEYYILYPEFPAHAEGYRRDGATLTPVEEMDGYVSPRLGIRFATARGQLALFGADGLPLPTVEELHARAADERERAEVEARRADAEHAKAAKLAAKLRELGIDPDAV